MVAGAVAGLGGVAAGAEELRKASDCARQDAPTGLAPLANLPPKTLGEVGCEAGIERLGRFELRPWRPPLPRCAGEGENSTALQKAPAAAARTPRVQSAKADFV